MNNHLTDIEAISKSLELTKPPEQLAQVVNSLLIYNCVLSHGRNTSNWNQLGYVDCHMFVLAAEYALYRLATSDYDRCYNAYLQSLRDRYLSVREMLDLGYIQVSDCVNAEHADSYIDKYGVALFTEVEDKLCTADGFQVFEWNPRKMDEYSRSEIIVLYDEMNEPEYYILSSELGDETENLLKEARLYLIRSSKLANGRTVL